MIKPIHRQFDPTHSLQLSAAKPRSGLRTISDLIPRLIRSYELRAEASRLSQQQVDRAGASPDARSRPARSSSPAQQTTFAWYQNN